MEWVREFGAEFYQLLSEMAPYLLLGFLFAGLLKAFFPSESVVRFMGRRNFRSVLNASLLGVPMPLCSCGVIPTAVSFFRNGASRAATTSFLISTPQTGVDSILATYAMLGLPFAIVRPVVAFLTGILGGTLSLLFDKSHEDQAHKTTEIRSKDLSLMDKVRVVFRYGFGELVEDIVKWLAIGLLAAGLLSVIIPDSFFTQYIGNQWIEMLIMLSASVPLYICATGSIPLAAVLLMKGISPGAALVFLMAGPATNVATIMVIGNTMGKRSLLVYLGSIIGGAVIAGFLVNTFLPAAWFTQMMDHSHNHEHHVSWIHTVSAVLLVLLMALAAWNKWIKPKFFSKSDTMDSSQKELYTTISVEGMTCNHCKMTVEKNLSAMDGIEEVAADPTTGQVRLKGDSVNLDQIAEKVNELGYQYKGKI